MKARAFIKHNERFANQHIEKQDEFMSGFSDDLDPDPSRVLRTRLEDGKKYVLEVKADGAAGF